MLRYRLVIHTLPCMEEFYCYFLLTEMNECIVHCTKYNRTLCIEGALCLGAHAYVRLLHPLCVPHFSSSALLPPEIGASRRALQGGSKLHCRVKANLRRVITVRNEV